MMRKVFFFVRVIQCAQGHSLPWVFAPTGAEQNIPFARSWPCPQRRWCPAPAHPGGRCRSPAGTELQGQAPSCAVSGRPSPQTLRVGEPRGPGRPELTAAPKAFIATGTGTKSLWAELCAHDTHPNLGPRGWSAGGASSRTVKANSDTVLSVQIIRDCIVAIFVIAD